MKRNFFLRAGLLLALSTGFPAAVWAGVNCWSTHGPATLDVFETVAVDPRTPTTLYTCGYEGVYKSLDGGETWDLINNGFPQKANGDYFKISLVLIDPSCPTTLYASGDISVYKSTDGGSFWGLSNGGLVGGAWNISMSPHDPQTLFASDTGRLYKSTDGALVWRPTAMGGLPDWFIFGKIVWDPVAPETLYAPTNLVDAAYDTYGAVFRSTDGGDNWEALGNPFPAAHLIFAVAVDPSAPSTLYAAGIAAFGRDCIFKSTDSGSTWDAISSEIPEGTSINSLVIDSSNPAVLYAAAHTDTPDWGWSGGVFRTADGGETWAATHRGLPYSPYGLDGVAIDPLNPAHIYAAYKGVYSITMMPVAGDCDGDLVVSIGEVQRAVNMFLGLQAPGCGVDPDGDGTVTIGEVQIVINGFLGVVYPCPEERTPRF